MAEWRIDQSRTIFSSTFSQFTSYLLQFSPDLRVLLCWTSPKCRWKSNNRRLRWCIWMRLFHLHHSRSLNRMELSSSLQWDMCHRSSPISALACLEGSKDTFFAFNLKLNCPNCSSDLTSSLDYLGYLGLPVLTLTIYGYHHGCTIRSLSPLHGNHPFSSSHRLQRPCQYSCLRLKPWFCSSLTMDQQCQQLMNYQHLLDHCLFHFQSQRSIRHLSNLLEKSFGYTGDLLAAKYYCLTWRASSLRHLCSVIIG